MRAIACSGSRGIPRAAARPLPDPAGIESECGRAVDERGASLVEGAVAAPDDDEISVRVHSGGGKLPRVAGSLGQVNGWAEPGVL